MEISNPEEVRQIMQSLVSMGLPGAEALRSIAADTSAGPIRVPAVLTMAYSRDTAHGPVLRALCSDKDALMRREALTALTKVHPKSALEDARRLIGDPDETVSLAAGEAYRLLGGKPAPAEDADALPAPSGKSGAPARAKTPPKPSSKPKPKPSPKPGAKTGPKTPSKAGNTPAGDSPQTPS